MAIKKLKDNKRKPEKSLDGLPHFLGREMNALIKLHEHPNIVKLNHIFAGTSSLYLVFEYVSGGELWKYLRRTYEEEIPFQAVLDLII